MRAARSLTLMLLSMLAWTTDSAPVHAQGSGAPPPTQVKALIVGVPRYEHLPKDKELPRAEADARGMERMLVDNLKVPPSNVTVMISPKQAQLRAAWMKHIASLKPRDVSIFYFSGHGAQVDKEPLLLVSDYTARPATRADGIALVDLLSSMRAATSNVLAIYVIDACRTDARGTAGGPSDISKAAGGLIASSDGLGPVRAPSDAFVFYAASSNQIALHDLGPGDGSAYSVYTRDLLTLLADPMRGLHEVAKDLRWRTYQLALGRKDRNGNRQPHLQIPAYFDEVLERRNILGDRQKLQPAALPAPRAEVTGATNSGGKSLWACPSCPELVELPQVEAAAAGAANIPAQSSAGGSPAPPGRRVAIGRYEVTRDEWRACQIAGKCRAVDGEIFEGDRRPISRVTWDDAKAYTRWLGEFTKLGGFRLPTEAEWERAARAGSLSDYGPASDVRELCEYANGADASLKSALWANTTCNDGKGRGPTTVGSYRGNHFGLHDMQGNVWEWVEDCRGDNGSCQLRLAKGGSWRSGPEALKISSFMALPPSTERETVGFRVARDLGDED